ncbi:ATP-grasp domain-containing protein [Selenomonas sp. ND2010]|uniref:ATP-grasp domain-containing protein n=1 Tax=Selenomonas sp. ND2010 TaxID=1410618 RepID=UPI0018CC7320|nr:ATP-grasp domain-containing protein [Selenomonas sp. ND2010]
MKKLVSSNNNGVSFDGLQTPCFIINLREFQNNIRDFSNALKNHFPNRIVAYSVKTNSLPYLLSVASAENCFAEVVSSDEYELAKSVGYSINHIVYNGPMKSRDTFYEALSGGAYVNIETMREIEWLKAYQGNNDIKLGIRVNVDLGRLAPDDVKKGEENSRFGFDIENGELKKAIEKINSCGHKISGIHLHRTSRTRSLNVYKKISEYANYVLNELKIEPDFVDIGGGYFGKMPGKPQYNDYVEVFLKYLNVSSNTTIIVEPGNGLVASPIDYLFSIIDKKIVKDKVIFTSDGSRIDVDPFFHKKQYNYTISSYVNESKEVECQKIAGCTCLENDVITELFNEKQLHVGDKIRFKWQGAYTMGLTPNFIRYQPNVYVYDGIKYVLVRHKWSAEQVCQNTILEAVPEADTFLFTNAGRRATLMQVFKKSLGASAKIIAEDNWCVAPALFKADKYYLGPKVTDPEYIDYIFNICEKENVKVITTCIDPEIELLSRNRDRFIERGILPLCPSEITAELCFDKYKMFRYLQKKGINTVLTYDNISSFEKGLEMGNISFPVFIKPRTGSGSVGAEKISTYDELKTRIIDGKFEYIIQEFMDCEDCDADVYVDTISHEAVAAICKKKIETRIGGASKTIAFKDQKLLNFISEIVRHFDFYGPIDMDFFYKDGEYYLSEINPRFGGAYLHGFFAGVDIPKMIRNNLHGITNSSEMGCYDDGSIMIMYDDIIMTHESELLGDYND